MTPEHEIAEGRRLLNRMYDAFVYRHGPSPRATPSVLLP